MIKNIKNIVLSVLPIAGAGIGIGVGINKAKTEEKTNNNKFISVRENETELDDIYSGYDEKVIAESFYKKNIFIDSNGNVKMRENAALELIKSIRRQIKDDYIIGDFVFKFSLSSNKDEIILYTGFLVNNVIQNARKYKIRLLNY